MPSSWERVIRILLYMFYAGLYSVAGVSLFYDWPSNKHDALVRAVVMLVLVDWACKEFHRAVELYYDPWSD